jgi:exosortase
MQTADRLLTAFLAAVAVLIWSHDRSWLGAPDDALPLLAALPLFVWLAGPWRASTEAFGMNRSLLAVGGVTFVLGLLTGLNLLLALAWASVVWAWLSRRVDRETRKRIWRLLPLLVLAFPWLSLDFPSLGWWFRISAAASAEFFFQVLGFAVHREGTQLLVAQVPFDVTPACSGIKALQAMMIAGTTLCFLQLGGSRAYWAGILCLPLVAWLANASRVVTIVIAALSGGPEFASGWFHSVSGWLVIVAVFGVTYAALELARRATRKGVWA